MFLLWSIDFLEIFWFFGILLILWKSIDSLEIYWFFGKKCFQSISNITLLFIYLFIKNICVCHAQLMQKAQQRRSYAHRVEFDPNEST